MASKKSALTAALSGAPAPAAAPVEPIKTFLDPAAFPCIQYADVVDGRGPTPITVEQQLAELDITSIEVVGSAPTNVLLANGTELADYALNPRRRRGGQEAVPDGLAAASSSVEDKTGVSLPRGSVSSNFISQAVIGSLPKGLTNEEKMKRQQSVPQSPSRALLNTLPLDQVASRTLDGRKVRRQVLKGAVMVFVTAGYSGKRFIFEKAKALGVRSIVLDGPDSWVQLLENDGTVAKFVPIDFTDAETVYDRCYKGIAEAAAQIGDIDGITTFCEIAVPLASRLAEAFGLPCNSVEAVDNARDKHATRDIMAKAGLPSPKHYKITSPEDVPKAAEHVGFPAVIKPVSGAASIGVIRVNNVEELDAAYKRVAHDMSKARIVAGALVEGNDDDPVDDTGNAGTWIQLVLMLEEYMDGDEVDCDLVFWDGRPVYGAVTDNWPTVEPYFNETGSNCPSILAKHKQVELLELSVKAVQALGFRLGVFHVECKYTSRGARLIEVNCRMGGGPVRDTNLLVWGVDLVEEHLMACAGIPVKPPVARVPLKQLAEYSINAKITGIMEHVDYCNKWQGAEHVMYCRPLVKAGQKVVCVQDGLPTWVAECMVTCPSVWEAIALVKKIDEEMEAILPIKPLK